MEITITTVNVNGIRAAFRKGMESWLDKSNSHILLLQEVRAEQDIAAELFSADWEVIVEACKIKGRAGVAVAVRKDIATLGQVRRGLGEDDIPEDTGRWLEADIHIEGVERPLTVVSAYLHSGQIGTIKQEQKMSYLPRVGSRLQQLSQKSGQHIVVAGDFNIVRSEKDIKNWKPNHNKTSGVLDEEIVILDHWFSSGWVDVSRAVHPEEQGPYTWWSWRGKAFDNNAGWRIDYQMANPELASSAQTVIVDRAADYESRFSDHAPLVATYQM